MSGLGISGKRVEGVFFGKPAKSFILSQDLSAHPHGPVVAINKLSGYKDVNNCSEVCRP